MTLVAVLGVALVSYEKKDECAKSQDGAVGWSPVAHLGECIGSLSETLSAGSAAAAGAGAAGRGGAEQPAVPLGTQVLASLSEQDHALGRWVYLATRRSSVLRHAATAVTLSGDEATWFALPVVLALGHCLTGMGPPLSFGFGVELLNDVMMTCVIEMGMKFCVQRDRPPYAPQGTFYILPGEWWSFPSGHSMRATYLAHRLCLSPPLRATIFGPSMAASPHVAVSLYLWALLVGWSRVAKGRHSPCDVVVGLLSGILVAELTLLVGPHMWTVGRFVAGSAECIMLGVMAARPELRLEGFYVHAGLQVLWFSAQPYNLWLAMSWGTALALSASIFGASYALGWLSRPCEPPS